VIAVLDRTRCPRREPPDDVFTAIVEPFDPLETPFKRPYHTILSGGRQPPLPVMKYPRYQ
jgi:hypothetical protein